MPCLSLLCVVESFDFLGGVGDDILHRFVAPDIVGERCDVEVSEQDGGLLFFVLEVSAHFFDEVELVGKLGVFFGVGFVSSRRHIEVVEEERAVGEGDLCRKMSGVVVVAEGNTRGGSDRVLGEDGNAVVGFFATDALVGKT